ncbi:hypothetical protein CASFOL_018710 [Castilleja foliolosa]|uniref:DUF4283 domain-containing protein n=1 Tax=Castilleja foliolosa TaxID=1961234 RepID=A0ABD3D6C6_9LAMI
MADDPPPLQKPDTARRTLAQIVKGDRGSDAPNQGSRGSAPMGSGSSWFKLRPVASPIRTAVYIDNTQACIISPLEIEEAAKQLEHALILKFTAGRPSLFDIRNHILQSWKLSAEPVVSLIDARHILVITATEKDRITIQSQDSKRMLSSLFRVFRWHKDFDFTKDSPRIPVWVSFLRLPLVFMNPGFLEKAGNILGKTLRIDDKTICMTNVMRARVCVELDVSKQLKSQIFVGESKDHGFWQPIEYEGNNAFCSNCGLLGHVNAICRKMVNKKEDKGPKGDFKLLQRNAALGEGMNKVNQEVNPTVQVGAVQQEKENTVSTDISPIITVPSKPTDQQHTDTTPLDKIIEPPYITIQKKDKGKKVALPSVKLDHPQTSTANRFAALQEIDNPVMQDNQVNDKGISENTLQLIAIQDKIKELENFTIIQPDFKSGSGEDVSYHSEGFEGIPLGVPESLSAPSEEDRDDRDYRGRNKRRLTKVGRRKGLRNNKGGGG